MPAKGSTTSSAGTCLLLYGKERITLHPGDAAYYDATVPHCTRKVGKGPCQVLTIVASSDYLFHGDLTELLKDTPKIR